MLTNAKALPTTLRDSKPAVALAGLCLAACLACSAELTAAPLRLGDDVLNISIGDNARIRSLAVHGRELLVAGRTAGPAVYDLGERKGPVAMDGRVVPTPTGARLLYDNGDLGLRAACIVSPGPRHTIALEFVVEDLRKTERGLTLEFGIPLGAAGWTWWDGPDASRPVKPGARYSSLTRLRGLPGLPEFDKAANLTDFGGYSWLPVAAVTGKTGLGLAKPPRAASLFRLGFDGGRGVFYCAWDFALSQDTRAPGRAEFSLVLFPVEPADGFRGALAELYELFPDDFRSRVPAYGGWMPFERLSRIADVDEFGFAYQEGAPEPAFDDALGASSFVYFHCAGEFVNIPGYTRGKPLPPYDEQLAAVNAQIRQGTGIDRLWDVTGIRQSDGRIEIRPESTYGHLFAQPCVDPDLPYGRLMADRLTTRVVKDPFPTSVDGCYYDGLAVGLDYAREHFKVTKHPLLWDPQRKRAVAYNFFASLEWAEHIADTVHPRKKLTMLNDSSVSSFPFVFPHIDVLGAEGGWANSDDSFLRIRAYAYHKPFCTLLKADFRKHSPAEIETYMRSCLVFGHLFGFFDISPSGANPGSSYWEHPEWYDRDRVLFRRYMPLCAELCRAGWEPVPLASAGPVGVKIERFGGGRSGHSGDLVFYTIRRRPDSPGGPTVTLQVSDAVRCATAEDAVAVDLLSGAVQPGGKNVSVDVPAGEIGVVAVGTKTAQIGRATERILRLIEARQRYQRAIEKPEPAMGPWSPYMKGAEIDRKIAHQGTASLRVRLDDPKESAGATRTISLNQEAPEDLVVRGFSRAEGVSGRKDSGYSIYVDCYSSQGRPLYGQTIQFDTGTHGWQEGELRIRPTVPIRTVSFYCMFRSHTGTVWFDDVFLARASAPGENLLDWAGFEPPSRPAADQVAKESGRRLEQLRQRLEKHASAQRSTTAAQLRDLVATAQADLAWVQSEPAGVSGARAGRDFRDVAELLRLALAVAEGKPTAGFLPTRLILPPR